MAVDPAEEDMVVDPAEEDMAVGAQEAMVVAPVVDMAAEKEVEAAADMAGEVAAAIEQRR